MASLDEATKNADPRFVSNRQELITRIAELLKAEMAKQKLSVRNVAKLLGLKTARTVVRLTNGYDSRLSTISDAATALGKRIKITLEDE